MSKQYGLIKPEKNKVITRLSIFNESSDSDDNSAKPTGMQIFKKKDRLVQDKILAEDPTVYQYDELYDEMQTQRTNSKLARKDLDKKPKYINKLLETAERRKRENERRIERQVQKEREEEGDTYKDKESFVTSAYRKKLEEMKELEEKEKREEYLEAIGDVKKQSDLSGFYRHLYAQQVNFEEEMEKKNKSKDKDKEQDKTQKSQPEKSKNETNKIKRQRKYRKHENVKSSEEDEVTEVKLEHLPSNLDADSDFSIDSDSDSEPESKKSKCEPKIKQEKEDVLKTQIKVEESSEPQKDVMETVNPGEIKKEKVEEQEAPIIEVPKKPKKDIWKKRTVGVVFDEALKRYYERKAAREIAV